jgi:hypothetical protein
MRIGPNDGLGAKPEASGLEHELPLSADSSHSRDHNRTAGFDATLG